MDDHAFADLLRALAQSRRSLLAGSLALAAGWLGGRDTAAKNNKQQKSGMKHKKKKNKKLQPQPQPQPPPLNAFGCLDVGQPCQGDSTLCCSGICEGVAPKNGMSDTSTCVGHSVGKCTPELSLCVTDDVTASSCNLPEPGAMCLTTTGNAGFCASNAGFDYALNCQPCQKDKDCEALGFQAGSACVIFQGGSFCRDECAATGGRACMPPAI